MFYGNVYPSQGVFSSTFSLKFHVPLNFENTKLKKSPNFCKTCCITVGLGRRCIILNNKDIPKVIAVYDNELQILKAIHCLNTSEQIKHATVQVTYCHLTLKIEETFFIEYDSMKLLQNLQRGICKPLATLTSLSRWHYTWRT